MLCRCTENTSYTHLQYIHKTLNVAHSTHKLQACTTNSVARGQKEGTRCQLCIYIYTACRTTLRPATHVYEHGWPCSTRVVFLSNTIGNPGSYPRRDNSCAVFTETQLTHKTQGLAAMSLFGHHFRWGFLAIYFCHCRYIKFIYCV